MKDSHVCVCGGAGAKASAPTAQLRSLGILFDEIACEKKGF